MRKQITLIPDIQHEIYPKFFPPEHVTSRRRSFSRLIYGSGAVGTISEFARSVIRARYPNRFDDFFLMTPGSQFQCRSATGDVRLGFAAKIKSLQPFFFFPANLWPHKNHAALLEAFKQFRADKPEAARFSLILSGHPRGWDKLAAREDTTAVVHLGYLSMDELMLVYQHATALVFLSLYEGFGIPVLEAFGLGCPVLCSNKTSLPEIAQDAALVVDPDDISAVVSAMAALASDRQLRES